MTSVQALMEKTLKECFLASVIQLENESHGHSVAPGSETHFKLILVAEEFVGKTLVQRHRMVYKALEECMSKGVHALAIHTYTHAEWLNRQSAPDSPKCMGGNKL